ncbi:MAG: FecR family protein [Lachnospiraceae bacterium]|nr:FecR family protein [Lachnospiraceae bacterium]
MKEFIGSLKGKIVIAVVAVVIIVAVIIAVFAHKDSYRTIAVEKLTGTVAVAGEKNNGQAYVGQRFYSGDDVTVADESDLTMCMDQDKYVYADAKTHFVLKASAASEDSRISIYLDEGSTLHELKSKLKENESYEVDTPSSTMSVRGTTFRVSVVKGSDDMVYTLTEVDEGEVVVRLKSTDGTYNGVEKSFTPGQSALVRANDTISEFVTSDMISPDGLLSSDSGDSEVLMLSYDDMSDGGVDRIEELISGVDKKIKEDAEAAKAEEARKAEEEAANEAESVEEEIQSEEPASEEAEASDAAAEAEQPAEAAQAVQTSGSDVDAIAAYAASLGYDVYKYPSDGRNGFLCSYYGYSKGKIYNSQAEVTADASGPVMRYVSVSFTTSDFVTITEESANLTDYNNPMAMFNTIVAPRQYTGLDSAYQLLSAAKASY